MSRLRPDLVVAVAMPLVCLAALLATHPDSGDRGDDAVREPERSALTAASLVCPSRLGDADGDALAVASLAGGSGEVSVGLGDSTAPVAVSPSRPATAAPGPGPAVVLATGGLAPSIVAGRSGSDPLVATDCRPPAAEQWFTGLGAGATHSSVIELVNPNPGRAVGDVVLWSPGGPVEAPELLGISVPGGESVRLDLARVVPKRGDLMARVTTSRGRLAVDVADSVDELGTGLASTDWLAPQPAPEIANLLLGLARGEGERVLVLGNPGEDEARATVRVVTPRSVFAPAEVEPVAVPPGSTKTVVLSALLDEVTAEGAIGLLVESTAPVAAALRQTVGEDLSEVSPAATVAAPTAALVPPGRARLLLADPTAVGAATVVALDERGEQLATETVELTPDTGASVALPEGTAMVTLTPERAGVRAALLVTGRRSGTAVVQLRELLVDGLVPDVRPALP